ncbi:MAG: tRNA preQ1(34) S-adenosylmethionine ribosyltransferase-isomerase QueA [Desulfamplus sp.]|nr:tRNA preQ1(34) S-adenosylmethionine ribosyltransferase-isomerase QueA [Desulfamplus sp.]
MYLLSDYNYELPPELIAQDPIENRDESRLLRVEKRNKISATKDCAVQISDKIAEIDGKVSHYLFKDIESILKPDDLLIINNTRVIPARLKGYKESGGKVEVLILDYIGGIATQKEKGYFECECMIRASKSPKPGTILKLCSKKFGDSKTLNARVESVNEATFNVRFLAPDSKNVINNNLISSNSSQHLDFDFLLEAYGEIPLPPYIRRENMVNNLGADNLLDNNASDNNSNYNEYTLKIKHDNIDIKSYQTVYATEKGAVAAPTAGLHFTEPLIKRLKTKGVEFVKITLHVGYGTFSPVRVSDIREHQVHSEFYSIPEESAQAINRAKSEGRRIIAVGTTSVRTLEYAADEKGILHAGNGKCDLFIYPGYKFKIVDAIITNFHLPESTLLMLVSAFSSKELIFKAYKEAIEKKYRFFSYGDAMFIE